MKWRVIARAVIQQHIRLFLLVAVLCSVTIMGLYLRGWFETIPELGNARWTDTSLATEDRITDLIAHMSLREKIGQMILVEKNSLIQSEDIATYALGGLLSGAGAKPEVNTAAGWAAMIASYQSHARSSRLGIPLLYGADAVHGHALVPGATIFPHQIGLGATGDSELVRRIGAATAEDLTRTGVNWNYAPNLDLPQDIRWGRVYEAFSDDPLLTARLGSAYVRGLQTGVGTTSVATPVLATLKHFVGLGAMQWQTSTNVHFKIDQGMTVVNENRLREVYLPPFKAGIAAGAQSVMIGLNSWGNTKTAAEKYLVTSVLKDELQFKGFAVSDWYGVYDITPSNFLATVRGINAGIDMVMLPFAYEQFSRHVIIANRLGLISTTRIDDAVRRILRAKFAVGLFDERSAGSVTTPTSMPFSRHQLLARTAVAQSLVLLKNDGLALPIQSSVDYIQVAGSAADNVGMQSGAWTIEWQGVDGNWLATSTSILAGIQARAPKDTRIEYNATGTFAATARADIGIAIVGEMPYAEGWGDRDTPVISDTDLAAIKNLAQSSDKVLVIIVSGRPLLIEQEIGNWDALIAAWLPGSEGGGVADVLFGDVPFMGTLPLPWPKTSEQLPLTPKGLTRDGTEVLFPRYYGLSY